MKLLTIKNGDTKLDIFTTKVNNRWIFVACMGEIKAPSNTTDVSMQLWRQEPDEVLVIGKQALNIYRIRANTRTHSAPTYTGEILPVGRFARLAV